MIKIQYLNKRAIREATKQHGKSCGHEFLEALDDFVYKKINQACGQYNGGRKILNREVAVFVGIK